MRSRTVLSTLMLAALFLGACDHTPTGNMPPGPGYTTNIVWPLKVGNRWVGHVTDLDANGAILSERLDTIMIVGQVTRDGQTWYADQKGVLRRNDSAGILLQIMPGEAGHHRSRHAGRHAGEAVTVTATALTSGVSVQAGGRSALRSYTELTVSAAAPRIVAPRIAARCLYAPGLGPVLRETTITGRGHVTTERWELMEASVR